MVGVAPPPGLMVIVLVALEPPLAVTMMGDVSPLEL